MPEDQARDRRNPCMPLVTPVVALFLAATPERVSSKLTAKCLSSGESVALSTPAEVICHWGDFGDGETRYVMAARGKDTLVQGVSVIHTATGVDTDESGTVATDLKSMGAQLQR
jgi:hypothetical protein